MNFSGIVIGIVAFVIIGVFHPVVVKCEYHFTDRVWPVFLVLGIASIAVSFFIRHTIVAAGLGVLGCTFLWSIRELKEQTRRVDKGWFLKNPKRERTA